MFFGGNEEYLRRCVRLLDCLRCSEVFPGVCKGVVMCGVSLGIFEGGLLKCVRF